MQEKHEREREERVRQQERVREQERQEQAARRQEEIQQLQQQVQQLKEQQKVCPQPSTPMHYQGYVRPYVSSGCQARQGINYKAGGVLNLF
jgi:hypothetical protein